MAMKATRHPPKNVATLLATPIDGAALPEGVLSLPVPADGDLAVVEAAVDVVRRGDA